MEIKSRKLIVFFVALAIFLGNVILGSPIPEETLEQLLALVVSWLVAQGIADHGAQGTVNAALRAAKKGEALIDEVKSVDLEEPKEEPKEEVEEEAEDEPSELTEG